MHVHNTHTHTRLQIKDTYAQYITMHVYILPHTQVQACLHILKYPLTPRITQTYAINPLSLHTRTHFPLTNILCFI